MIIKNEIIKWLMEDGYDLSSATTQIDKAIISEIKIPAILISYDNGVEDIIVVNDNNKIIHINPA